VKSKDEEDEIYSPFMALNDKRTSKVGNKSHGFESEERLIDNSYHSKLSSNHVDSNGQYKGSNGFLKNKTSNSSIYNGGPVNESKNFKR
jgi:hypothetical protein